MKSEMAVLMRDGALENQNMVSRHGTGGLKISWDFPDAGRAFGKRFGAFPMRDRLIRNRKDAFPMRDRLTENRNIVSTNKNRRIMTKFNEKSLHSFALAWCPPRDTR